MFTKASRFQINGGYFYNVQGDFVPPPSQVNATPGVEFGLGQGSDRQRIEPDGTERDGSAGWPAHDNLQLEYHHPSVVDIPDSRPTSGRRTHPSDLRSLLAPTLHSSGPDSPLHMGHYFSHSRTPVGTTNPPRELYPASGSTATNQQQSYNDQRHPESHPTIHNGSVFPWNGPSDAPPTNINGGTFISQNVNNIQRRGETAGDAFHDSADRFPQPRCHPETRTKLLDILWKWSCGVQPPRKWTSDSSEEHEDNNGPSSAMLWLHGPAGSGKSAVAQSFCQHLQNEVRLGGSFFFKRGHASRGNANKLFPTIAYQLARLPQFSQCISRIVEKDPSIVDRSFSNQLHELIVVPCRQSRLSSQVVIVIDGLDECAGNDVQQEILSLIGNAVSRERLPLLFLIASRPESHISETLADPPLDTTHRPLDIEQSFEDVRIYLKFEFDRIHRRHRTMAKVPYPWPSSQIVQHLVKKSSGYFIYAATVVKFIDDKQFRPCERLNIIMGSLEDSYSELPFAPLDQLYHQILSSVPIRFRASLLQILVAIHAQFALTVSDLEPLLELDEGDVELILQSLYSVISAEDKQSCQVTVHHASFLDFLQDSSRSGPFHVSGSQCRTTLSLQLLKAFSFKDGDPSFNRLEKLA
ncbi:NACHT domain-containing protein [Mycena venus]|uniref:NACHT domain-containing protein n=1 Tax=Mycena venus TaxID=2733690 RepID=A0A8H7D5N4_9AGAR|nr:NACHT domain-containing protein [Mycena venus]